MNSTQLNALCAKKLSNGLYTITSKSIYTPDVFSSCYDTSILKCSAADEYGNNQIRYAYHLCAHSWYEDVNNNKTLYYIKKAVLKIVGKKNINKVKAFVHKDITV